MKIKEKLIAPTDAFEIYYTMGASRSLPKLHKYLHQTTPESTPSKDTLKRWSIKHNWQNLILLKDHAVYEGVAEKVTESMIDTKVKELEHLDRAMSEIDVTMPLIFDALTACTVKDEKTGKGMLPSFRNLRRIWQPSTAHNPDSSQRRPN